MSSRDWSFRINDILAAIGQIQQYLEGMTLAKFKKNQMVIDAVVRNFEIIGEATRTIPAKVRESYPKIPWNHMISMRNILIHEYFGVDVDTVWYTAKKHLPHLRSQLESIE